MQLLHLTDLHYSRGKPFQIDLIKGLLEHLKQEIAKGFYADFVVFSGDLVNNPDEPDIYVHFENEFLKPVLSTLNLSVKEVVFCPGNHDVSQSTVKAWTHERERLISALAAGQAELAKVLATAPMRAYLLELSKGYFDLMERCGSPWDNPLAHTYTFPGSKVSFVALNSAFGCGLEGSSHDRGKLAFPAEAALAAFQSVPSGYRALSLMHHTLSDLNESSSRELEPIVSKKATAHFFGHVHQAKPTVESGINICFKVQGGALYEAAGYYNGYSHIFTAENFKQLAVQYHTYYRDRMEFDVGTNVAKDGMFYNPPSGESYWKRVVPAASNDDVCLWLMETADGVAKELDRTITSKSLSESYIEPVITISNSNAANNGQRVSLTEILNSKSNIVISCPAEYGATSLLSFLTLEYHRECVNFPLALVPSFVDSRKIRAFYEAAVSSTIRSGLPESDDRRFKLPALHESGRLVLLIDDIDPGNNLHINFLAALRNYYPKARLIVAVKNPLIDTQRLRPIIGVDEFDFLQLNPLSRNKVRNLIEKWKLPTTYHVDTVVDEISTRFSALGIPQTAAYVVIYLSVLQDTHGGYNPVNSSTVIEQFVESALQKYKPVYAFRSSFDYKNQIDYLGAITENMCRKNSFLVEYSELYNWTKEYFERIGLRHNYTNLIDHFISNKVFADEGNSIYFRYNIFLSFFIAHRMSTSEEFRKWILEDYRYTNYISEIDIYCGLSRQDISTLQFLGTQFSNLSKQLEEIVQPLAWIDRLEKLSIPAMKKEDRTSFTNRINKQLTGELPDEKRDEQISNGNPPENVRPGETRPEILGVLPKWILTLRAYTVALKNLENISKEKKEEHLRSILQGWSTLLLYCCVVFKEVIEKKELNLGNMKFKLELPSKFDAKFLRLIFLSIPVSISEFLRRDLGSQKLALQLKNEAIPSTLSDTFLQSGLYADLKLENYITSLMDFRDKANEANAMFFLEVLLLKMNMIFLRLGLHPDEQDVFLHLAGEISADIMALSGEERQREINRYTAEMQRKDQVNKLRLNLQ